MSGWVPFDTGSGIYGVLKVLRVRELAIATKVPGGLASRRRMPVIFCPDSESA